MQTSPDAIVAREASIDIASSPDEVYALASDIGRIGEWSTEAVGGDWIDGGSGKQGDWFDGHNKSGEREWTRACEVARAEPGKDFTFVVGGVADNCTWWSYEMEEVDAGTRLTERWWIVNKTPAIAAATQEQFDARVEMTQVMLRDTIAAIKDTAESAPS